MLIVKVSQRQSFELFSQETELTFRMKVLVGSYLLVTLGKPWLCTVIVQIFWGTELQAIPL